MLRRDMPGFFKDLAGLKDSTLLRAHAQQVRRNVKNDAQVFGAEFSKAIRFMVILFIGLLGFLFWFKSNYKKVISTEKITFTAIHLRMIESPLLVAIFITCFLSGLLSRKSLLLSGPSIS